MRRGYWRFGGAYWDIPVKMKFAKMKTIKFEKAYLLIIFIVPVLIGIILLCLTNDYPQMYDAGTFINRGQEIAYRGWRGYDMVKEPGYPFLLSFLFYFLKEDAAIVAARILNIFLQAGSAVIFALIFQTLKPYISRKRIIIFSLLFGCSPQLITFSSLRLYAEPLSVFLNSVGLFCFIKIVTKYKNSNGDFMLLFWIAAGLATSWLIMAKVFFLLYPLWILILGVGVCIIVKKKKISFVRKLIKPIAIFFLLCYTWPFLWSLRNYFKYEHFSICIRGATTLLSHTYLVEMDAKDSLKWAMYQISANLGKVLYPNEEEQMMKQTGDAYAKAEDFARYGEKDYKKSEIGAVREWWKLVGLHPYKYALFTSLNSLNHLFLEGVYPDYYPADKSKAMRFLYMFNAIVFHVFYSLFIWFVILVGVVAYFKKIRIVGFENINLNYLFIALPLLYFATVAYHFHTEIRYLHTLYPNIYLLFCLSLNYWFDRLKENIFKKLKIEL